MGRSKVTARRGRGGGPRRIGDGRLNDRVGSSSSSNITTPRNGRDSCSTSETGSPMDSLPSRDLPDALIDFMLGSPSASEPPQKRQKLVSLDIAENVYEHVIVKTTTWDIEFAGAKLSGQVEAPLEKTNIRPYVNWTRHWGPEYIEIMDERKQCVFHVPLPPRGGLEDVYLALFVDHDSTSKAPGRLWTEFGLVLLEKEGHDVLQIAFTIKWNTTSSPYHVVQAPAKSEALRQVLARYFPDPSAPKAEKWTPQDFYQSVHAPVPNGEVSAMKVDDLETGLYPFQKRAVQWLLRREGVEWCAAGVKPVTPGTDLGLPLSFLQATDDLGRTCYVSHLFGLATLDLTPFIESERQLKGGILAEEMGLGKTVEMISLISLHKRPQEPPQIYDIFTAQNVRPTGATLIIAPPSILRQWISEINRHAPSLRVMHYEGIKAHSKRDFSDLVEDLAASDVVISTYSVLAAEIHFTQLNPEKTLRRESKYPRPKSPLMMLSWWRCLIDEAQMIESGVSNAAVVARMIPRVNAWCVTGTPVRKDVSDLLGLLVFLRYEPYASIKHVWSSLISTHKNEFRKLFGALALRHSKQSVREELKLPAQRRYVITMPFTPIEEQHYQELFNQMCGECGLGSQGAPLQDDWDPDEVTDVMRRWLVRLRQTALHPEVGGRNRRALGQRDGPLRTVDQVLSTMMENTDLAIRTDHRTLLVTKLKRGQLFENSPRVKEALAIWVEAADEAKAVVDECRLQLQQELATAGAGNLPEEKSTATKSDYDSEDEQEEVDPSSRISAYRNRLRTALEIEHMAIFFRTNAYFQIKSNEEMTEPSSDEFQALEKLEEEGYENAKRKRQEILQEIFGKADKLMKKVSRKAATQSFVQIPEFPTEPAMGGIESRRILEKLDALAAALDAQANILDEWRETTIQFLLRPLVDEDEGIEITGDEYEESTKTQDEVMVYVFSLRAIIGDRHDALTAQTNDLVKHDVKVALRLAKDGEGACPEKTIELLGIRQQVKPTKEMGSIRGTISELRGLATSLRPDAERGSTRAQNELAIVDKQLKEVQKQLTRQTKAVTALEKEIELLTRLMNARLEYYRQLQQVSDMVAPYEGPNNERTLAKFLHEEENLTRKIASAKAKRRYLDHLRMEATNPHDQRICVICRESFEVGALTVCGHQYCKDCIRMWWNSHHNCPVCKRKLSQSDMHQITYKPQELSIETEDAHDMNQERTSSSSSSNRKSAIYAEISKSKLAEIKNTELDGPSFTTKVDTLARHLIWLRESDPGAKSIIYSQFKDFLDVLAQAFTKFRIGFTSIDKPNGIEKFKQDPGIECFLLHARAHSSGLNLVNANHVFLCEPLLNTALELQAVARVDRIGQLQETSVWLYLISGTVEESIHQLSVKRRMEHIGKHLANDKGKGKEKEASIAELLDSNLEEANSMELQQASLAGLLAKGGKGGEMIMKEDLWDCLFGGAGKRASKDGEVRRTLQGSDLRFGVEVGRELRAEAAEERMVTAGGSG